MEYKGLNEIDLKLRLIGGFEIALDGLVIKPYTIREIVDYGYENYMRNIQWLSVTLEDFISSTVDVNKKKHLESNKEHMKAFDFYVGLGGSEFLDMLVISLRMIFRTEDIELIESKESVIAINFVKNGVLYENEDGRMEIDSDFLASMSPEEIMFVHRDNFDDLVEIIKKQNYLISPSADKEVLADMNPADDATRRLMETMSEFREKVESKKKIQEQKDEEDAVDFFDIIDAVSTKSNSINKLNIWDLCIYSVYREYARLELIDTYDFSIKAMIAGAGKIDLKHWSSKL